MRKSKVSDEQIIELIEKGLNNRQIAIELELSPTGQINNRCRELRKHHGTAETVRALKFEDIKKDDRLMREGKRLIVVVIDEYGLSVKNMREQILTISRKDFEKTASEYTKVPAGDPQGSPVKIYTDPTLKAGDVKIGCQSIKNLSDTVKGKIVEGLKEGLKERTGKSVEELFSPTEKEAKKSIVNPDFEAAVKEMEETTDSCDTCPYRGLETMDDVAECNVCEDGELRKAISEPDYIDPEWGIPIKEASQGVETKIMEKANKEIEEFKNLKAELSKALEVGGRLPGAITDKHNNIVSKYS